MRNDNFLLWFCIAILCTLLLSCDRNHDKTFFYTARTEENIVLHEETLPLRQDALVSEPQTLGFEIGMTNCLQLRLQESHLLVREFSYEIRFGEETSISHIKNIFSFENGSVAGLLPEKNTSINSIDLRNATCPCELFYCDAYGAYTLFEKNKGSRYKIVYTESNDTLWIAYCDKENGRLFRLTNNGAICDMMTFYPQIEPDTIKMEFAEGIPNVLKLDSIDAEADYLVDIEKHEISFIVRKSYYWGNEKP